MGLLVNIKCAIGVPEIKMMTLVWLGISIPSWYSGLDVLPRVLRVVRRRTEEMQLSYVCAVIACLVKDIAHAGCRIGKRTSGTERLTVIWDTALVGIHTCKKTAAVRTADWIVAEARRQNHRLACKFIQSRRVGWVSLKIDIRTKFILRPILHGRIAQLVGKHINDVWQLWSRLLGIAGCQGNKPHTSQYKVFHDIHIFKVKHYFFF